MRTASRPVAAESEAMLRNFSTPTHSSKRLGVGTDDQCPAAAGRRGQVGQRLQHVARTGKGRLRLQGRDRFQGGHPQPPIGASHRADQRRRLASTLQQVLRLARPAEDFGSRPRRRRMVLGQAEGQHALDRPRIERGDLAHGRILGSPAAYRARDRRRPVPARPPGPASAPGGCPAPATGRHGPGGPQPPARHHPARNFATCIAWSPGPTSRASRGRRRRSASSACRQSSFAPDRTTAGPPGPCWASDPSIARSPRAPGHGPARRSPRTAPERKDRRSPGWPASGPGLRWPGS